MIQTIKVFDDRMVSPSRLVVGNQYENQIETIKFNLPEYDGYQYLVINKNSESYAIPLDKEGVFYVDSLLTWSSGIYECNIVISGKELNESSEIDGTKLTFISNTIRLKVVSNSINASQLSKAPLPINLQIVYDDLLNLKKDIEQKLENGEFNGKDGVGIKSIEKTGNEGLVDTYTITLTDDSTFAYTVTNGVNGKSAYELALENGFEGTEEEWLESLRYDHSDEFTVLANQVKQDAQSSADNATKAENAMNQANTTAQENVKAINEASTTAQKEITTTKDNAVKAVQSVQQTAENAIGTKQTEAVQAVDTTKTSATQEITEQKESAVSAITQEKNSAIEAIETGKTEALNDIATDKTGALNDIATAKDNAIEEIENTGVPLEDIEKLAIKETAEGNPTIINDSADWRLQKLNVYGQSEQDSTTGKNLLNPTGATKQGWNINLPNVKFEVGKTFTFTPPKMAKGEACGLFAVASNTELVSYINNGMTRSFTVKENADFSQGVFLAGGSATAMVDVDAKTAMVELGSVATEFEPYTGGKPSPSPDYPQEIISKEVSDIKVTNGADLSQTITLSEPITLRGIPLSSGGNVTIDGQQYVADVITEKDGVIGVERFTYDILLDGLTSWILYPLFHGFLIENALLNSMRNGKGFCETMIIIENINDNNKSNSIRLGVSNKTIYSLNNQFYDESLADKGLSNWINYLKENHMKVVTYTETPTFEPLPEEIQAQYKALKSYYPNTVIQSGAFNEVTFIADTKTWIENKINGITELALGIGGK